nr:unnamed protein product [Callosobruchus analis]
MLMWTLRIIRNISENLVIWMGLGRKPTLRDYYSKKILYKSELPKLSRISGNRFEALLHFLQISDNEDCPPGDQLYKIAPLVQLLNRKFQHMSSEGKNMRRRDNGSISRQAELPSRKDTQIRRQTIFKLCIEGGYTYALIIYEVVMVSKNNTNVVIGKWKDKRDVLFLTTRAVPEVVEVPTKRGSVLKPPTIVEYNTSKCCTDVSGQKASYSSSVRRGIKWYRQL